MDSILLFFIILDKKNYHIFHKIYLYIIFISHILIIYYNILYNKLQNIFYIFKLCKSFFIVNSMVH